MKNLKWFVVLVALVVVFGVVIKSDKPGPIGDGVACTMEALICPDGSGVGRQGPMCEFSACSNLYSYTGTLEQTTHGFFLNMNGVEGMPDFDYKMPLKFSRVSNALADFVGKEVVLRGNFVTGNTLEVESIDLKEASNTGSVGLGETKVVNGVSITFHKVVEDSRCPMDVQCIQAGRLVASVSIGGQVYDMTLGDKKSVGIRTVNLVDARPNTVSTVPQGDRAYVLTFEVR